MPRWNRREFVAIGVGTVTAAITQDAQIATDHGVSSGTRKVTEEYVVSISRRTAAGLQRCGSRPDLQISGG